MKLSSTVILGLASSNPVVPEDEPVSELDEYLNNCRWVYQVQVESSDHSLTKNELSGLEKGKGCSEGTSCWNGERCISDSECLNMEDEKNVIFNHFYENSDGELQLIAECRSIAADPTPGFTCGNDPTLRTGTEVIHLLIQYLEVTDLLGFHSQTSCSTAKGWTQNNYSSNRPAFVASSPPWKTFKLSNYRYRWMWSNKCFQWVHLRRYRTWKRLGSFPKCFQLRWWLHARWCR